MVVILHFSIADEVRVFPLLGGCDLRVVFAPAMVYGLETEQLQVFILSTKHLIHYIAIIIHYYCYHYYYYYY